MADDYWASYEEALRREIRRGLAWSGQRQRYAREAPIENVNFLLGGPLPAVERLEHLRARIDLLLETYTAK